jgi:hypothetical protein
MTDDESPSFSVDILPMFRAKDVTAMAWFADLHSYAAVRTHSEQILARLEDGGMPCDQMWPEEDVDRFRKWMRTGMAC